MKQIVKVKRGLSTCNVQISFFKDFLLVGLDPMAIDDMMIDRP